MSETRRIYTRIVWDMESLQVVYAEDYLYDGPVDAMKKKPPSPMIGQASSISGQERGTGQQNINTGVGLEQGAVTSPTQSPLYKAMYNTEAGQMSKAYDTAASNTAAKARQAGFGYQQPVAQGAQDQLRSQQASQIGQLPGEVAAQTVPLEMQAGKDITGAGTSELGAGNQVFTQGAVPLEQQYQQYALNYTPLWQRMLSGGLSGATQSQGGGLYGALSQI